MSQILKLTNDKSLSAKVVLDVEILKDSQSETLNLWVGGLLPSDINIVELQDGNQEIVTFYPIGVKIGEVYSVSIKLDNSSLGTSYFGKPISYTATTEDTSEVVEGWLSLIQEKITADTTNSTAWSNLADFKKVITSEGVGLQLSGANDGTAVTIYKSLLQIEGDTTEQSLPVVTIDAIENSENTKVEVKDTLAEILVEEEISTINDINEKGSLRNKIKRLGIINFQEATSTLPQISFIKFDTVEAVFGDIYLLDIDGDLDIKLEVEPNEAKDDFITRFAQAIEDEGTGAWANVNATADLRNKHIRVQGEINVPFGLENVQQQVEQLDAHAYQLEFTNDINFTDEEDRLTINQKLIDKGIRSDEDVTRFSDASFMRQIRFEIGDINAFILRAKAAVRGQLKSKIAEGLRTQALYNNTAPEFGNALSTGGAAASDITEVGTDTISQLNSRFSQQVYCDPNNTAVSPTAYLADLTNYVLTYLKNNSADPNDYHWTRKDIKYGDQTIDLAGSTEITDDSISIKAFGNDIWGQGDRFRFVYKKVKGNGEFIARLTNFNPTHSNFSKAGLMLRNSLDTSSEHVHGNFVAPWQNGSLFLSTRDNFNGNTSHHVEIRNLGIPTDGTSSYYLKLKKENNNFELSYSSDGDNWTTAKTITKTFLNNEFYVGLTLAANSFSEESETSFEDIQLNGFTLPDGVQRSTSLNLEELEGLFHQNFAELPAAKDEITDLVCQTRVAVEVLRDYLISSNQIVSKSELQKLTENTENYFYNVYRGFLRKLDTSENEINNAKTAQQVERLTSKLGIPNSQTKLEQLLPPQNRYQDGNEWIDYKNLFRSERHILIDGLKDYFDIETKSFEDFSNYNASVLTAELKALENSHIFWQAFAQLIRKYAIIAASNYNTWVQQKKVEGWNGGNPEEIRRVHHQHQTYFFRVPTHHLKFGSAMRWFADYVHWKYFSRNGYSMQKLSDTTQVSDDTIIEILKSASRKTGELSTWTIANNVNFTILDLFTAEIINEAQPIQKKEIKAPLFEQKLEEIFGIEDTTKDPLSNGVIIGDGVSDIFRHTFDGIKWMQNTDEEGDIYIKLSSSGILVYKNGNLATEELVAKGLYDELEGKYYLVQENNSDLTGELHILDLPTSGTVTEKVSLIPSVLAWKLQKLRNNWENLDALSKRDNTLSEEDKDIREAEIKRRLNEGPIIDPDIISPSDLKDPYDTANSESIISIYNTRKSEVAAKLAAVEVTQHTGSNTNVTFSNSVSALAKDNADKLYIAEKEINQVNVYSFNGSSYGPVLDGSTPRVFTGGGINAPTGLTILPKKKSKAAFLSITTIQKAEYRKKQAVKISLPDTAQINENDLFILDLDGSGAVYYEVPDADSESTALVALGLEASIKHAIENSLGKWENVSCTRGGNEITITATEENIPFQLLYKPYAIEDDVTFVADTPSLYLEDKLVISSSNALSVRPIDDYSGTQVASIPFGNSPHKTAFYKDHLFITEQGTQNVTRFPIPNYIEDYLNEKSHKKSFGNSNSGDSIALTVDYNGNQFIADRANNKVVSLDKTGRLRFEISSFKESDGVKKTFNNLYATHVDARGNIYTAEHSDGQPDTGRVLKFDSSGNFVLNYTSSNENSSVGTVRFDQPVSLKTDANGDLFVVDQSKNEIPKFDENNGFLKNSIDDGITNPKDLSFYQRNELDADGELVTVTYLLVIVDVQILVYKESLNDETNPYFTNIYTSTLTGITTIFASLEEDHFYILRKDGAQDQLTKLKIDLDLGILDEVSNLTNLLLETNLSFLTGQGGIDRSGTIYLATQSLSGTDVPKVIQFQEPQTIQLIEEQISGSTPIEIVHTPYGIDVDQERGYVYVSTKSTNAGDAGKVWKLDETLYELDHWGMPNAVDEEAYSETLKVDPEGNVWVFDALGTYTQKQGYRFSGTGELVGIYEPNASSSYHYRLVNDIVFDPQGRLLLANDDKLTRIDVSQGFGNALEAYLSDGSNALTHQYFVQLKNKYLKGEDIESEVSKYGLELTHFNELSVLHSLFFNEKTISETRMDEFYQLITSVWKKQQFQTWIEEESNLGISLSPDYFTPLSRKSEKNLNFKKWLVNLGGRREWRNKLKNRIEQEKAILDGQRIRVGEVEDENLISLRDALIVASDFEGDSLQAKAKDATDKLIIDFKNNCCQRTTRISMAMEALQGIMWGVRNGLTQDTYSNLYIENDNFDEEWRWMGSYANWRAAQFTFMYPENLTIPQLKRNITPSFQTVLDAIDQQDMNPQLACELADDFQKEVHTLGNLKLIQSFQTDVVIAADRCKVKDEQGGIKNIVFLIGKDEVKHEYYWTYFESNDSNTIKYWQKIENDDLQEADIFETLGIKKIEKNNESFLYFFYRKVFNDKNENIFYVAFNLETLEWEDGEEEVKVIDGRDKGDSQSDRYPRYDGNIDTTQIKGQMQLDIVPTGTSLMISYFSLKGDKQNIVKKLYFDSVENEFNSNYDNHNNGDFVYFDDSIKNKLKLLANIGGYGLIIWEEINTSNKRLFFYKLEGRAKLSDNQTSLIANKNWGWGDQSSDYRSYILDLPFKQIYDRHAIFTNGDDGYALSLSTTVNGSASLRAIDGDLKSLYNSYLATFNSNKVIFMHPNRGSIRIATRSRYRYRSLLNRARYKYRLDVSAPSQELTFKVSNSLTSLHPATDEKRQKIKQSSQEYYQNYKIDHPIPERHYQYLEENFFHLPIALARALQQNGYYTEALDYYRYVYDWTVNSDNKEDERAERAIYFGLSTEKSTNLMAELVRSGDEDDSKVDLDWLSDPLNPHAVAKIRPNTYTKFTVMQIAQCMLEYADSEFTKDTAETVPRARTLYRAAIELLDSESLRHLEDEAVDLIETIRYEPEEAYLPIWEKQRSRMLTVETKAALEKLVTDVKDIITDDGTYPDDASKIQKIDEQIDAAVVSTYAIEVASRTREQQVNIDKAVASFIASDTTIQNFLNESGKKVETQINQTFEKIGLYKFDVYQIIIDNNAALWPYQDIKLQEKRANGSRVNEFKVRFGTTIKIIPADHYIEVDGNSYNESQRAKYVKIEKINSFYGSYETVLVSETEEEVLVNNLNREGFVEDSLMATLSGSTGPSLKSEEIIDLKDITGDLSSLNPDFVAKYTYDPNNPTKEQIAFQKTLRNFVTTLYSNTTITKPQRLPATQYVYCVPANPVVTWMRITAELNLFKIRNCRNIAGVVRELAPFAAPTDATSGINFAGSITAPSVGDEGDSREFTPTIYRYQALIARAKELTNVAQQVEASYLATLEKIDNEAYSLLKAEQDLAISKQGIKLQKLRIRRADSSIDLAELQKERAEIQFDHYDDLIRTGLIAEEKASLGFQYTALAIQVAATSFNSAVIAVEGMNSSNLFTDGNIPEVIQNIYNLLASISQTQSSILQQQAGYIRREQEWNFARDLADKDIDIADQQIEIAEDEKDIVEQEKNIAELQTTQAQETINFLKEKFTSKELYTWMSKILEDAYRFFLQRASNMALLAEEQLRFERQEEKQGIIQEDYWESPIKGVNGLAQNNSEDDRRGLTGSVRLLKDIYQLDEMAFTTRKRKLQLKKTFSLASLDSTEFANLRTNGVMNINLNKRLFERDFPTHYLRLITKVDMKVVALVPPTDGIKATLRNVGISYVDVINQGTGDIRENVEVRREPEVVAFTGNSQENGAFALTAQQNELLNPFENTGVMSSWSLSMPKAANQFDYSTIADVLFTIEYTALESIDYGKKVIERLNTEGYNSQLTFSLAANFADSWYDILNSEESGDTPIIANFEVDQSYFPANVRSIKLNQLKLIMVKSNTFDDGERGSAGQNTQEMKVLSVQLKDGEEGTTLVQADAHPLADKTGVIRTGFEGTADSAWSDFLNKQPYGYWSFELDEKLVKLIKEGKIEDIFMVIDYKGDSEGWLTE